MPTLVLHRVGDRVVPIAAGEYMASQIPIVLVRLGSHAPTRAYVERRTAEGLSKPEIMRCLKRYVARELFPLIQHITAPATLEEGDAEHRPIAA